MISSFDESFSYRESTENSLYNKSPLNGGGDYHRSPFRFDKPGSAEQDARWSSDIDDRKAGLRHRNHHSTPTTADTPPPPPRASLLTMQHRESHDPFVGRNHNVDDPPLRNNGLTSPTTTTTTGISGAGKIDPSTWVLVVHGVKTGGDGDGGDNELALLRRRFGSYGAVVESRFDEREVPSNWICFRYRTRAEAKRALAQDGTFAADNNTTAGASSSVLLAVRSLNRATAQRLGIDDGSGGGIFSPGGPGGVSSALDDGRDETVIDDEHLLLGNVPASRSRHSEHKVREGLWYKTLSWVFMWD